MPNGLTVWSPENIEVSNENPLIFSAKNSGLVVTDDLIDFAQKRKEEGGIVVVLNIKDRQSEFMTITIKNESIRQSRTQRLTLALGKPEIAIKMICEALGIEFDGESAEDARAFIIANKSAFLDCDNINTIKRDVMRILNQNAGRI